MGIVNLNCDSIHASSRVSSQDEFRRKVDRMLGQGVSIIDIGAVSSRPGAAAVSPQEEWERLEPALEAVARHYTGYSFSIDTFRSSIVLMAYQTIGRFLVNDISAGEWDEAMLPVVGRLHLRYVAMHHCGTFETMHNHYDYDDVTASVKSYFEEFSVRAKEAGIEEWILDPGFGFSKDIDRNFELLEHLDQLKIFRKPILVGISHKRFAMGDSESLEAKAVAKGASIIRKHID